MKPSFTLRSLPLLLGVSAGFALADPVETSLPLYCNQRTGALFVSGFPDEQPSLQVTYSKHVVRWGTLLKVGPEKNQWGDPLRTGSRNASNKCGPFKVIFSSGFLNSNPQGELGAIDFPVVEIRKGNKVILEQTALELCDVNLSRYNYFGECPDRWAKSIEVVPTSSGHEVRVKRAFTDAASKDVERIDLYK